MATRWSERAELGHAILIRLRGSKSLRRHGRASSEITAATAELVRVRKARHNPPPGTNMGRHLADDVEAACKRFDAAMRAAGKHLGCSGPLHS